MIVDGVDCVYVGFVVCCGGLFCKLGLIEFIVGWFGGIGKVLIVILNFDLRMIVVLI